MKLLRLIVGIGGLLGCAAASAGVGVWSGQGPFGGYVYDVLQAAASPSTLYVSTRSGIFKSIDAGASWAPAMNGIVGSVSYGYPLALDADVSNTLYAADSTGHLYRTSDGAANWLQTGYVLAPLALGVPQIIQITDSPGSTTRIYVVTYASGVLVSNDSGATFSARNGSGGSSLPAGIPLQTIAVDPADANNLLAGTAYDDLGLGPDVPSLYRSTDAGATWTGVVTLAGGGDSYYGSVTDISFGNGSEVYANIDGTIYRSANSGGTWAPASGSPNYLTTVQADPAAANSVFAGGYFGLMHSSDGGTTFTSVAGAANGLTPNGSDVATVSRLVRSGANWLIATQEAGIFRSSNFGSSWTGSNNGLDATNIRALGMIPASPAPRILAGYGDAFRPSPGVYAGVDSGDGSMTWANSNTGLRAYQIRAITVDPTTTGTPSSTVVYAGGRSEQAVAIAPRNGGVYKSLDGGSSWTTIDNGLPLRLVPVPNTPHPFVGTVRSIVLDPHSCAGYSGTCTSPLNTVYGTSNGCKVQTGSSPATCGAPGTYQFRIFKSTNGGTNWASSDAGIPQSFDGTAPNYADRESLLVVPLVIDPLNPNILYAGTSDTFDSSVVTTPTLASGIYKSTDNGATWNPVNTGLPTYPGSSTVLGVLSLAIHPTNPLVLWATVIDINSFGGAPGHIYKTVTGGASWTDSGSGLTSADIRALLVDPTDPNILFAAGGGTSGNPGGVFKSYDGGDTWHSISIGLPADAALSLALDPGDHNKLYAGTSSGVYEITQSADTDFDGASDIQENLGPNAGDSNFDGTPDRLQSGVTYVPAHVSASAPSVDSPKGVVTPNDFVAELPVTSSCSQLQDVQAKSASANGPDVIAKNLDFTYGVDLLQFEILNCATTTIKVTYPNFSFGPGWSFRFFGPALPGNDASIKWYDFSSHAVKLDAHSWQLTLTRGAFGSYRPSVTGSILFQGGPAYSDRIFASGFD